MTQKQKGFGSPDDEDFTPSFAIPKSRDLRAGLTAALQAQHQEESLEDQKEGRVRQRPKAGVVCICEGPACRIGPMKQRP